MRVAFVADDLYPGFGGQAAASEGHIEALLARGHKVRILAGSEKVPKEPPPGVLVERLPAWSPGEKQTRLALPDPRKVQNLLLWADVVQTNTPTPLAVLTILLAKRRNVPSVVGFHTQEESAALHFTALRPAVGAALGTFYSALYRLPDGVVAPSPFAADLAGRYTNLPVRVVSNGIRLPEASPEREKRAARLKERLLGGAEGSSLISHVGRLTHEKRSFDLLEIASALARLRDDWRLVVAGSGPLRGDLERRTEELGLAGRVRFLGYVPEEEKDALLRASDLFLMPSPTELQSIATLEAMARGCAVVVLDAPTSALGTYVREAGCGLCYLPGRFEEAAGKVSNLLDRPEELLRLAENARAAATEHDVNRSGEALEEIYTSLLRSEKRTSKGDLL